MTVNLEDFGLHPKKIDVFDSSMLSDFADCPSKFYLRHILGLKPKRDYGNPNLDWGTKWHDLMFAWGEADGDVEKALEALDPWPSTLGPEESYNRTRQRMELCFRQWVDLTSRRDRHVTVLRREQYFEIHCGPDDDCPFGGCDLSWCGRIDRLDEEHGRIGPLDFKTTRALGSTYWDMHKHGFQIPGYTWATAHLTNQEVRYAYLDCFYCLKTKEQFFRRPFMVNAEYIKLWRDNVKNLIARAEDLMENHLHDPEAWEMNRNECTRYGLCVYADVHFVPNFRGRHWWETLQQDFVEDRWDPSSW